MKAGIAILGLLQASIVSATLEWSGFRKDGSDNTLKYGKATLDEIKHYLPGASAGLVRDSAGRLQSHNLAAVSPYFEFVDLEKVRNAYRGIIDVETRADVHVTIYKNDNHILEDRKYDRWLEPWKDRTTGKTMYREIKGKFKPSEKKGPPNAYGSHTTHGIVFKDVHTGETCDARGQAHISFSPTRWARNSKPDEDDRTFAAIRKDGAKFPKLESIKGLRKTMIHEFLHALNGCDDRGRSNINDGPPGERVYGVVASMDVNLQRVKYAHIKPTTLSESYTNCAVALITNKQRGRFVAWMYGKINPKNGNAVSPYGECDNDGFLLPAAESSKKSSPKSPKKGGSSGDKHGSSSSRHGASSSSRHGICRRSGSCPVAPSGPEAPTGPEGPGTPEAPGKTSKGSGKNPTAQKAPRVGAGGRT